MEMISQWVAHYGYAAIFFLLLFGIVGLPVPDEWLMTFAGYLVYEHLRVFTLIALALLAVYIFWHYRRVKRTREEG